MNLPKISLPLEGVRIANLRQKHAQYLLRIAEDPSDLDAVYKATILQELLQKGQIATCDIYFQLRQSGPVDDFLFNNACQVIIDYCQTGGHNVRHVPRSCVQAAVSP